MKTSNLLEYPHESRVSSFKIPSLCHLIHHRTKKNSKYNSKLPKKTHKTTHKPPQKPQHPYPNYLPQRKNTSYI